MYYFLSYLVSIPTISKVIEWDLWAPKGEEIVNLLFSEFKI